jgi:diguanylate cyclase (GGDEF)-like protein
METRLYFQMLQRGWWVILLTSLLAVSISLGLSYMATPQYQATASFIITPSATLTVGRDVVNSLDTLDRRSIVANYAEVMNSHRIYADALTFLQLDAGALDDYKVLAVVLPESSVLELDVSGPDPKMAAELANAIGYQTIKFSLSFNQVYDLNFLDTAATPDPKKPVSPQPLRDAGLALLLGAAAGALLVILSEQIRIPLEAYRQRLRVDSLTGVYNARYFRTLLEAEVARHPEELLSVGIVELYGLHDLMETIPASAAQRLLRTVTERLRNELRGNDTIGRWSETNFIVMLPATPGSAANRTFDRIYQSLVPPIMLDEYGIAVNADPRVGGSVYSNDISSAELVEQAESALEQARKDNTHPVYIWEMKNPFWVHKTSETD